MAEPEPPAPGPGETAPGLAEARFLAELGAWAAGQRVAGAAGGRARLRSLTEAAAGSATLVGVLVDLAERESEVTVALASPAPSAHPAGSGSPSGATLAALRLTGRLIGVGRDFCVLERTDRAMTLVRLAAVTAVWSSGTATPRPSGDRPAPLSLSIEAVLAELAASGASVVVGTLTGPVEGDLVSVGEDVLTLRHRSSVRPVVHVPTAAVQWCEMR